MVRSVPRFRGGGNRGAILFVLLVTWPAVAFAERIQHGNHWHVSEEAAALCEQLGAEGWAFRMDGDGVPGTIRAIAASAPAPIVRGS